MKYNLGFGNSVCVRKAFLDTYKGNFIVFTQDTLEGFDYPNHFGDPELVEITRQSIKRQTGQEYEYIILTNGATGAINIALSMYRLMGYESCITRKGPYYLRYPTMIASAGLEHITESQTIFKTVSLLDVPSNPLNLLNSIAEPGIPVVLDGVYLNNVYTHGNVKVPKHDIFVGSSSKLTGLNGARIGYLATNDYALAERLKSFTIAAYCGLARSDSILMKQLLHGFDWDTFEIKAKNALNNNREEISKLEKFMGDIPVQDVGMFHYGPMDKKCQELFAKAGIIWTKGSDLGTDDNFGRLNIGQDCQLIKKAVKAIMREDRT